MRFILLSLAAFVTGNSRPPRLDCVPAFVSKSAFAEFIPFTLRACHHHRHSQASQSSENGGELLTWVFKGLSSVIVPFQNILCLVPSGRLTYIHYTNEWVTL